MNDETTQKTCGSEFLETVRGVRMLHLHGNSYERGFQHGFLLADAIIEPVPRVLDGAAAVIAKTRGMACADAQRKMQLGVQAAADCMPQMIREEIRGLADGLREAAGDRALSHEQLLLWNIMYDQWCIYARPRHGIRNKTLIRKEPARARADRASRLGARRRAAPAG